MKASLSRSVFCHEISTEPWQVLWNRRQILKIGGKSVLVHASDNHAVWIIKDTIWEIHRRTADACEIFGMLNIWTCLRFKILLREMSSDWKIHWWWPTANERARYSTAGRSGRSYRPQYHNNHLLLHNLFFIFRSFTANQCTDHLWAQKQS